MTGMGRLSDCLRVAQPTVKNFINGRMVESKTKRWIDVRNPATQELVCRVPQSTPEEVGGFPQVV